MWKISLLLMAFVALSMADMKIKFTRKYFWLNKEKANFYINAWPLTGDDAGTYGSTNGSENLYVQWKRELAHVPSERMLPKFYLNYDDQFPEQFTGFGVCKDYNQFTLIDLGQDFFNKILASYSREEQCPIPKDKTMTSAGNLEWERSKTTDVHCDTPVTMILILVQEVGDTENSWGSFFKSTTYTKHKIFEAVYTGEFTDCT